MTKKVVIVGTGAVGSTCAYTLLLQEIADTIVLVDINKDRTVADSLDMTHALPFTNLSPKQIISGEYSDAADADLVIITANAPAAQLKAGDSRLSLLVGNVAMIKDITTSVMASGFDGIFLIASNPVDLITRIVAEVSGLPKSRVIGTGTLLDSARMKTIIADKLQVNPNDINGCVMGEHGESSFTAWSNAQIFTLPLDDYIQKEGLEKPDFDQIDNEIRQVGFDIFQKKGNTSYGIASALATIARAIFRNESTILPVSSYLSSPIYDVKNLYIGIPTVISEQGAEKIIELELTTSEQEKFRKSAKILEQNFDSISAEL
ncbi:MAG: L-lactate dehydrogenase [Streptococcaceae bacterium]|jgi:L-lactate dehydrogenase|nr:L-lactate dehydrogenase [Streptococcaceae bacterium]